MVGHRLVIEARDESPGTRQERSDHPYDADYERPPQVSGHGVACAQITRSG